MFFLSLDFLLNFLNLAYFFRSFMVVIIVVVLFVWFFIAMFIPKLLFFLRLNFTRSLFDFHHSSRWLKVYNCFIVHIDSNIGELIWTQPSAEIEGDDFSETEVCFFSIFAIGLGDIVPQKEINDNGEVLDMMKVKLG